jgi:hypothetical protein
VVRRQERKDTDAWQLALVNERRLAKNQAPIEKLDELKSAETEDAPDDPLLIETANILLDYAELSSQLTAPK